MANPNCTVRTQHLGGEALLIDLGPSAILSDHPHRFGGSDKGPLPGDLMKGALAASVALALGEAADKGELPRSAVTIRCTSTLAYEPTDGPMQTIVYVPDFHLDIAVSADLDEEQIKAVQAIAAATPLARALCGDLLLDEANAFIGGAARPPIGPIPFLADAAGTMDPAREPDQQSPASAWVDYIGNGRALINWPHSSCIVSAPGTAVAGSAGDPNSLLLASLAACTTVFSARAATRTQAKVDLAVFCEGRIGAPDGEPDHIVKRLEISGDVTAEQRSAIAFAADHCALGETLRRRAALSVSVRTAKSDGIAGGLQSALAGIPAADCDDGACCVPQAGQ